MCLTHVRRLLPLLLLPALALAVGCASSAGSGAFRSRAVELTALMDNEDLLWEMTPIGLQPLFKGKHLRELRGMGKAANPALIEALKDPTRFAVAHALLTEINLAKFDLGPTRWNGLRVSRSAGGRGHYNEQDMPALLEFWEKQLGPTP